MLPTPSTSHVNYTHIYEPAEDSYLLLDTLSSSSEANFLHQRFPPSSPSPLVLEVGTGSGVVLAFAMRHAQHIFDRRDVLSLGVDLNLFACKAAFETVRRAEEEDAGQTRCLLSTLQSDLTLCIRNREVDVLIFNPPYVPTEELPASLGSYSSDEKLSSHAEFERDSHLLALSYAGGVDGMETTNRLLAQLPEVLSSRGLAYVLLCAQNRPEMVASRIRAWPGGWCAEKVGESGKTAGWEKLCVLRIWRSRSESTIEENR